MNKNKSIDQFRDAAVVGTAKITGGRKCALLPPVCETDRIEKKGNNGFGNGADANLAAPGGSGATGGGKEDSVGVR